MYKCSVYMRFKEADKEYSISVEHSDFDKFITQVNLVLLRAASMFRQLSEIPYVFDVKFSNEVGSNIK